MAAQSGMNGRVLAGATPIARIKRWTYTPTSNNPSWSDSDTSGETTRIAGVKDSAGSFDFVYESTDEILDTLDVGTGVTLNLYITAVLFFAVPAIIDDITFEVDIETGEPVGGSCTFSQTGAKTNPV